MLEAIFHELSALIGTIFDGFLQFVSVLLLHLRKLLKIIGSI